MAYKINIPFDGFKLQLFSGETLITPLNDLNTIRLNEPIHQLAGKYAEKYQREVINQGAFASDFLHLKDTPFESGKVTIKFPADKERLRYSDLELVFDYFYQTLEKGYWAVVPALALQAFADNLESLLKQLQETIQLYFLQGKKLSNVQDIVSAIWYRHISWEREEVLYSFPTPDEVSYYVTTTQNPWLPRLAQQILIENPVMYGRAKELEQLVQALQNPFQKNILLVGENGVGKSVLIYEAIRVLQEQNLLPEIWETTAARLIKELIQQTGWQDNIVFLCNELVQKKAILYVRNLMELFEVGQYEGNEVSLGLYLRSVLSQGEIALVTECTEDELAQIELKNSNYTTLFQIIRLNAPTDELQMIILQKSKDLASNKQISISEDAIKEIVRLNKRYTPYSGFPGKPIRFLENIISDAPKNTVISKSSIVRRFCEETGMPPAMVDETIPMDVASVKAFFTTNIFGQPQAVEGVVDILASVKAALMRKEKPIASFLFVGPTGVGKTELAKVLAEFMFGNRERMVRFDMSEYGDDYSVTRLIGTSVGSDGVLTSAIRREPFCVLLFDEIEKASSKFFDLLLPVLGEGRLSDSKGKTVNFCATIIIMTSNIGVGSSSTIGLGEASNQSKSAQYIAAVQKHFRPELFNRFDEVIPFEALSKEVVRSVVNREIEQLKRREGIAARSMHLEITPAVLDYLAEKGYSIKYGARHLQRTIREELSIPLATKLNLEDYDDRLEVQINLVEGQIAIEVNVDPKGVEVYLEELDKIVNTDHASRLRRNIQRLQEGMFYIELQNELKILEILKTEQKDEFWQVKAQVERYRYFVATQQKVEQLAATIQAHETELSLACMGMRTYEEALSEALETWQNDFFDLKRELYGRLNPEAGRCFLYIYGAPLSPVFQFYLQLLQSKQFELEVHAIWYQDRYYQEILQQNQRHPETTKEPFFKILLDKTFTFVAPKNAPDALLFGVEIELIGDCVLLYLEPEVGIHRWKYSTKENHRYLVQLHPQKTATPFNIHRKDFYRQELPRRVMENGTIRDTLFHLKAQVDAAALPALIASKLDELFETKLNVELI